MQAAVRNNIEDVTVSLTWSGPTVHADGKHEIAHVAVKGLPNDIVASNLPTNLRWKEQSLLNFTVKDKNTIISTGSSLTITSYQLSKIQLVAGTFSTAGVRNTQGNERRADQTLRFQPTITETHYHFRRNIHVEAGFHYNIVCTVGYATLIKCDPPVTKTDFQLFVEELQEAQRNIFPDMAGSEQRMQENIEAISEKLFNEKSLVELEKMLVESNQSSPSLNNASDFGIAVALIKECISIIKEENNFFEQFQELLTKKEFANAWALTSKLDKRKAEALKILIKSYVDSVEEVDEQTLTQMYDEMPEGMMKEEITDHLAEIADGKLKIDETSAESMIAKNRNLADRHDDSSEEQEVPVVPALEQEIPGVPTAKEPEKSTCLVS